MSNTRILLSEAYWQSVEKDKVKRFNSGGFKDTINTPTIYADLFRVACVSRKIKATVYLNRIDFIKYLYCLCCLFPKPPSYNKLKKTKLTEHELDNNITVMIGDFIKKGKYFIIIDDTKFITGDLVLDLVDITRAM